MAVVYKAEDSILGRSVALKTLRTRYAEEPAFRQRFKQEARAMASLDHQNIVKVYDIAQDGEVPFIVAEYVRGYDVGDLLKRNATLNEKFARKIVEQLLDALAYAHRRGIIHRDIKPSNILINTEGVVKVADFGIARFVEDNSGTESGERGEIVGSARYMSPEQLRGGEATPESDIYSVGILLYHCLTGSPPFSGDIKSLAHQHLRSSPRPPRKINRKISPEMEAVILKALAKDPKDRYPTADAVLDDLETGAPSRSAAGGRTAEAPMRSRAGSASSKRGRLVLASGLLVLLLAGGTALASGLGYVNLPVERGLEAISRPNPTDKTPIAAPKEPVAGEQKAEKAASEKPASEESANKEPKPENVSSQTEASKTPPPEAEQSVEKQPPAQMLLVPNVLTYYDYSAVEILNNRGFKANIVYAYKEGYADRGVAWGTDPAIGTMAPAGSVITVYATPKDYRQPQIQG